LAPGGLRFRPIEVQLEALDLQPEREEGRVGKKKAMKKARRNDRNQSMKKTDEEGVPKIQENRV